MNCIALTKLGWEISFKTKERGGFYFEFYKNNRTIELDWDIITELDKLVEKESNERKAV